MKEQPHCEVYANAKIWFLHGRRHREDGPAVEYTNGGKAWWLHGKHHREDGPACEWADGRKEWWLNNEMVDPETIVDLWLSRGTFCYYNEQTQTLHFAENE